MSAPLSLCFGGGSGIRTHGTLARTTVFETAPFDRSGIPPRCPARIGYGRAYLATGPRHRKSPATPLVLALFVELSDFARLIDLQRRQVCTTILVLRL